MGKRKVRHRASVNLLEGVGDAHSDNTDHPKGRQNEPTAGGGTYPRNATIGIAPDSTETIEERHEIEGEEPTTRALDEDTDTYSCADCDFPLKRGESSCPSCHAQLDWGKV